MKRHLTAAVASITMLGSLAAAPAAAHADQTARTDQADQTGQTGHGADVSYVTIPGDGGIALKAFLVTPTGRGDGPFPLLVMPSSWTLFNAEYVGAATKLATERGYEVISYTSRGFWDSEGEIEIAGEKDTRDAGRIIDWAIANAGADERRVGMAGISYGAGISLLTAARDKRVRAVSAMSGWTDLLASLYPNQTLNGQAAGLLLGSANLTGRPGEELKKMQDAYLNDKFESAVEVLPKHNPITYIDQINANRPAVMMASGWIDGILAAGQFPVFFEKLRGPKRLMLQPGDHATPEALGAVGLPNEVWEATGRWFDRYLKGADNGVDREAPVQLKAASGGGWHGYGDWRSVGPRTLAYRLDGGEKMAAVSTTSANTSAASWARRIAAGKSTVADTGVIMVRGAAQQAGIHWKIRPAQVDRSAGAVWSTAPVGRATTIGGAPVLRTIVTPSARNTSLFAYLYDVGPDGEGRLVTHAPYTLREVKAGRSYALNLRLDPVLWKLAKGHRLTLVVDTMDIRYRSTSKTGTTVTFGATAGHPSTLTVPIG